MHGDYARPTAAAMALMCAAVNAGWAYADVDSLILGGRLHVDAYMTKDDGRRRSIRSAAVKARRDWDKATAYVTNRPTIHTPGDAHRELGMVRAAIHTHTWTGRSGPRDKAVLLALVAIGESLGTVHPTVSVRTLTEDTPYRSWVTIKHAIDSLHRLGWISIDKASRAGEPSGYTIRTPPAGGQYVNNTCSPPRGEIDVQGLPTQADALATALTVRCANVYVALTSEPASRNRIAKAAGVANMTCSKWLAALARLGLAVDTGAGWVRGDADPDVVAKSLGVEDVIEARAERHALHRAGYRQAMQGQVRRKPG